MSLSDQPVYAYGVMAVLVGAVLWPMLPSAQVDSFPLSTFPMFSHKRPSEVDIDHVVAVDQQGHAKVVPPALVAGAEVLQTKAAISYAVSRGRQAQRQLCGEVAGRLAQQEAFSDSVRVEVRRDRYHVLRYFSGDNQPLRSQLFARCPIPRAQP